jgi:hypothetical protein
MHENLSVMRRYVSGRYGRGHESKRCSDFELIHIAMLLDQSHASSHVK